MYCVIQSMHGRDVLHSVIFIAGLHSRAVHATVLHSRHYFLSCKHHNLQVCLNERFCIAVYWKSFDVKITPFALCACTQDVDLSSAIEVVLLFCRPRPSMKELFLSNLFRNRRYKQFLICCSSHLRKIGLLIVKILSYHGYTQQQCQCRPAIPISPAV